MARKLFDENAPLNTGTYRPEKPQFACTADQCPAPGTIFPGATHGGGRGLCVFHYGANASDWPRITQVLKDWECVGYEFRECRRVMCDPATATDPRAQNALFGIAWKRLQPLVAGYEGELAPRADDRYDRWGRRLEEFVGGMVVAALRTQYGRAA